MSRRPRIRRDVAVRLLAAAIAIGAGIAALVIAILEIRGVLS
jgi:hypothetical protein